MDNILLYASLLGTAAFAATFIMLALRKPPAMPTTGDDRELVPRGGLPSPKELGDMAEKFNKSGPQATAATLTVFFFTAALVTGGVLDVSLDAGTGEAGEATEP